jgi:hypothetical protein
VRTRRSGWYNFADVCRDISSLTCEIIDLKYEKSLHRNCVHTGAAIPYRDACNHTNLCKKVSCLISSKYAGVCVGFACQPALADIE